MITQDDKPAVLFVCIHNAGRSQMAAAFLSHLSQGTVEVRSAGSVPADQVNPAAVAAMAEVGIDIAAAKPTMLTIEAVKASDVVITMGAAIVAPSIPASGTRTGSSRIRPVRTSTPYGPSGMRSGAGSKPCLTS